MKRVRALSILCLLSLSLQAAEVDHFSFYSEKKLKDSLPVINKKSNQYLIEAVSEANDAGFCSEELLYKQMRKHFNNHIRGDLVPWINEDKEVGSEGQNVRQTIYKNYKWYQSIVLGFVYRLGKAPMGYVVNLDGKYYGTDKFEHFFGMGFRYFTRYHLKGDSLDSVLKFGASSESGLLGASMTGVYSQGDLGANFNGMRFWNHVLQKNNDVLGKKYNAGPYVKCQNGLWKVAKKIDWSLYFDQSFSEAHNCSKFRTESLYTKAVAEIKELSTKTGTDLSCPYKDIQKEALYKKYGPQISKSILNLDGHTYLK